MRENVIVFESRPRGETEPVIQHERLTMKLAAKGMIDLMEEGKEVRLAQIPGGKAGEPPVILPLEEAGWCWMDRTKGEGQA